MLFRSPTHVGRHPEVFAQAIAFTKAGGYIDITTSGGNYMGSAADAFVMALEEGAPIDRITFSSDGHGSMPRFDKNGEMIGLTVCKVSDNLKILQELAGKIRMPVGAFLPCQKAWNCRRTSRKSTEESPHHRTANGPCDPGRSRHSDP